MSRLAGSVGALLRAPLGGGGWRALAAPPRGAPQGFPRLAARQGASVSSAVGGGAAAAARSSLGLARLAPGGQRGFHGSAAALAHFPVRGTDDVGMVHLGNLRDNPGARKPRQRTGRGTGSGRGKMSGFGHKGQKSRAGNKGLLGFEGGQTPAQKRYPKRGFTNKHAWISKFDSLSLNHLMYYVNTGRLDTSQMITLKHLRDCGAISASLVGVTGVKLLKGTLEKVTKPIHIEVSDFSKEAKRLVEEAGGSVKKAYYNKLGLRALLKPEKFDTIPRRAAPPPRLLWKYPEHYKDVEAQMAAKQAGESK